MKNNQVLTWSSVAVALIAIQACGGGGGGGGGDIVAASSPAPAPAPAPAPTVGTWTSATTTCINQIGAPIGLTNVSLGHIPCLAGTYFAIVQVENFSRTGPRVGKTCNVTIGRDGSFSLAVDGIEQIRLLKTVEAVIDGYEQSSTFNYHYVDAGPPPSVDVIKFDLNLSSISVTTNPLLRTSIGFLSPSSKLHMEADYKTGAGLSNLLVCEG